MASVNPITEYTEFVQWGDVWISAVALAWTHNDYATALKKDPAKFLFDHFCYELPWPVELRVIDISELTKLEEALQQLEGPNEPYTKPREQHPSSGNSQLAHQVRALAALTLGGDLDQVGWDRFTSTWTLPKNLMFMLLPPRPDKIEDQAVALAAYQSTGRSYPFTTC